jgi:Recombinase zinc beta ribbon domain
MAWCAYCGGMLGVKRSGETRKDGSRLLMYRCQTNVRQPGRCKGVNISQLPLDKAVWARIQKLMSDRDYFRMMAEDELESQQSANNPESWLKDINKQIDDVATKQQSLAVRLSGYRPGEDDDIAAPVEEELRKLGGKEKGTGSPEERASLREARGRATASRYSLCERMG